MARKKPSNIKASGIPERIARTDAKGKQTQLETRLGRLVLKMPACGEHVELTYSALSNKWFVYKSGGVINMYDNPIDALLAAGITDE